MCRSVHSYERHYAFFFDEGRNVDLRSHAAHVKFDAPTSQKKPLRAKLLEDQDRAAVDAEIERRREDAEREKRTGHYETLYETTFTRYDEQIYKDAIVNARKKHKSIT